MTPQIYLISNPAKPTHRRLSFKNDMTTFEKGLGWVAELVNGDAAALPVRESGFFSREAMTEHSDGASKQEQGEPVTFDDAYARALKESRSGTIRDIAKLCVLYTTLQRKPLPQGEWPKHPRPYIGLDYVGYSKSDLDQYALQVLAVHGIAPQGSST